MVLSHQMIACSIVLLLTVATAALVPNNVTMIQQDIPVNGTIASKETLNFLLNKTKDWRFYVFGFKLTLDGKDLGEEVGKVKLACDSTSMEIKLRNGYPTTHFMGSVHCENDATIDYTNSGDKEGKFWMIVANVDSTMYNLNSEYAVPALLPGDYDTETVNFRGWISKDEPGSGAVDVVNVTVYYDAFASTEIRGFVSQSPRPETRDYVELERGEGVLYLSIHRNSKLFCQECFLYVTVQTKKAAQAPVYLSAKWLVDRDIIYLKNNEDVESTVEPDSHGQHFIIDLRELEYDSDVYIGIRKLNEPDTSLTVDLSLTSFDDGEWDIEKSTEVGSTSLREWGIHREESCFHVGAVYYLRVTSKPYMQSPCRFSIVFRITRVPAQYIYLGKKVRATSRDSDVGITYYRINIPKESFVDVQSVTVTMTNLQYTCITNSQPTAYCIGFDVYMGKQQSQALINNPRDPSSYTYTETLNYRPTQTFTITEKQAGWCTDCTFGFSVRTTRETQWLVTAELGFAPFMMPFNTPREGSLKAYTHGIETYFYLHLNSYERVEVAVEKKDRKQPDVVLFVSTQPHASIENHFWTDSTVADGRAEIELFEGHPQYCQDCFYYIGVYYMDDEQESDDTQLAISVNCPNNACRACDKPGLDPSKNCGACLPGYFGSECTLCPACNHGTCDDGLTGTGQCKCSEGWGPEGDCVQCLPGFFGLDCAACPSCNGHGTCDDGLSGTGKCKCDEHFDARRDCENCEPGFFGMQCQGACPRTEQGVCDKHGLCDDMMLGDGFCRCNDGFVGLKCDTPYAQDKCNPHCVSGKGGCDQEKGVCVCYYGNTGKDCGSGATNVWVTVSISLMTVIILMVAIVVVVAVHRKSGARQKKTRGNKGALLADQA